VYRAEASGDVITLTIAGGDSTGATPPISASFGDTPTIQLMNAMGFNADGLGNHNFDKGESYLRNTLIPLAQFPYLSSNIMTGTGTTPAEWSPSKVFTSADGTVTLGLVGFSNEDIPSLIFPGRCTAGCEVHRDRSLCPACPLLPSVPRSASQTLAPISRTSAPPSTSDSPSHRVPCTVNSAAPVTPIRHATMTSRPIAPIAPLTAGARRCLPHPRPARSSPPARRAHAR